MTEYVLATDHGRWKVTLHAPDDQPDGACGASEAIIMIDDATTVLIREEGGRLNTPGDRRREGESFADAMLRAVRTKACAEVTSYAPIAFTRTERLDGPHAGEVMVGCMHVARVTLLPWIVPAGVVERVRVPLADLAEIMAADWVGLEEFSAELVVRAQLALSDLGHLYSDLQGH